MSTAEFASNLERTASTPLFDTSVSFSHVVTHVLFPAELPETDDCTVENDLILVGAVCAAAHAYTPHVRGTPEAELWYHVTKMLDNLRASWTVQSGCLPKGHVFSQLRVMETGDITTFFVRHQNAAIIVTKRTNSTLFESFEVSPAKDAVEKTSASLVCSYPWSAVETPNELFDDEDFLSELAHFLSLPDAVDSDLPRPPRDHPEYITALFTGILRGVGQTTGAVAVSKRIRDNIGPWPSRGGNWRRSTLWLLIRIAIQMSVERSSVGRVFYKRFVLYFICTLGRDRNNTNLSNDLLHLMSSKIFRRLNKLGLSAQDWLSEISFETCAHLREILDARWNALSVCPSTFRNPSQEELVRDTKLSLSNGGEYIRKIISTADTIRPRTLFNPNHHRRATLADFLSLDGSFFDEAYRADPDVTIYDVEQLVEQEIDDWIAHVSDVNDAYTRLDILMDRYCENQGEDSRRRNPERSSIKILTMLELFVALDKLSMQEVPMIADYSPGISITWLEKLCLRKPTSLHRLSCAYQYLVARELRSHPGWSVLSDEFTEDCFPVRYYDQSPNLQQLKVRIEEELRNTESGGETADAHDGHQGQAMSLPAHSAKLSKSLLFPSPLHAKVVVFELQCPPCFRIWRSAITRIYRFVGYGGAIGERECRLAAEVPEFQPYLIRHPGQPRLVYFHPDGFQSRKTNTLTLRYSVHSSRVDEKGERHDEFRSWQPQRDLSFGYRGSLGRYVDSTSHVSNDIFAEQAKCPKNFSLDEFVAFAHLRSGATLQWLNVLCGLRTRTLNLRRKEVHFLFSHATLQAGPLDRNTATWIWHQELQHTSFCNALIDELGSLFVDGTNLIDWMFMNTISLLLTRVLASSPSQHVSERATAVLQRVRKKTFSWVQELSYDLQMAPMNAKRKSSLLHMALVCRSTFDVDRTTLYQLVRSAEDVDAILSCSFFVQAVHSSGIDSVLRVRDSRLTLALEEVTRDVALADPSNHGLDLAIAKIFRSYRPGALRSEPLQYPNTRWVGCKTKAIQDQPLQTVHVNLLDGQLRANGQAFGKLPREIKNHQNYEAIFGSNECFVVPSDLPEMDVMTLTVTSNYKVYFSQRGDNLVVRAQCIQTSQVLEFVPSEILHKDLPPALVDGRLHWLDTSTGTIEIRPCAKCWEQSVENWRIECSSGTYRAYKNRDSLVDIQSPTWTMLSKCFEPLVAEERSWNGHTHLVRSILITTSLVDTVQSTSAQRLSVALPHIALSFFVNDKEELESRDFEHMVYDEDQSIQTLFGLKNLIVLKPTTSGVAGFCIPEALIARVALIPDGSPKNYRSYHIFKVDPELGFLVGNGDPKSMQFLAHLHATTNFHRPDPLTGKTGTRTALDFLQSARCRSIVQIKALDSWISTKYPQLNAAHDEIQARYYWDSHDNDAEVYLAGKRAAQRAIHIFPPALTRSLNSDRLASPEVRNDLDYEIPKSNLELHDLAYTVTSAVHRWSTCTPTMGTISNWVNIWKANIPVDPSSKSHDDPKMPADLDLVQRLVTMVRDILGKATRQRFRLQFLLPTLAYCSHSYQTAFLSMLMAFASQEYDCSDNPPGQVDCKLSDGYRPTEQDIRDRIRTSFVLPEDKLGKKEEATVEVATNHLLNSWPSNSPPTISLDSRLWNTEQLIVSLQQLFLSCYDNWNLKERLILILAVELGLPTLSLVAPAPYTFSQRMPLQITLDQLLSNRRAPGLPQHSTLSRNSDVLQGIPIPMTLNNIPALDQLLSSLQTNLNSAFQQEYLALLETSASVHKEFQTTYTTEPRDCINMLRRHYMDCRTKYMVALKIIKETLGPATDQERVLEQFCEWPPITPDVLLRSLASTSRIHLSDQWKQCLVLFTRLLLELQRARRLLRFALDGLEEDFLKELENEQCDGWNPEEYPDWLLIQVQGDFLIRRAQAETAMHLMFPRSGGNTVMQVNMGEGKSSVIIPIVAATLADGKQLVRIIVPKALMAQMFDILVARLGWLTDRPIYHLPFSRTAYNGRSNKLRVGTLLKLMSQCMAEHGILLVQPEHVVSLKLMGVEKQISAGGGNFAAVPLQNIHPSIQKHIEPSWSLNSSSLSESSLVSNMLRWFGLTQNHSAPGESINSTTDEAAEWLSLQKWIHSHVRDVLDESDEILHPRFQLIYTIGLEQHIDGYPDRWTITQQILHLVKGHLLTLSRNHPSSIEYERGPPGSFPRVRILRSTDIGERLISMVVEDVMAGRFPNFNFEEISSAALRGAIRSFISDKDILQVSDTAKIVEEYAKCSRQSCLWDGLLLLRGLLSSNILLFALSERRWRVDYGLFLQQQDRRIAKPPTMLAVPFRAKDVPAPNTQFGHPDLTIILTCLSYYYGGLTEEQLRISFEILLDQDDPAAEYQSWIKDYDSLPQSLQKLTDINPRSSEEWDNITRPLFSRNQRVIDFYLSQVVFPREAKEFSLKLCGSSWDLGEKREKLVTGFSGTSDCRWLLPMSVVQYDFDHQLGVSTGVLGLLLRQEQENTESYIIAHENGERQATDGLLKLVAMQRPKIRVLLDVGAQILDLSNYKVAEVWLSITRDAEAAIYFNNGDELMVLTRNGKSRPLSLSPFSQQLDKCLVYLDHPHTRGTDLKFPIGSRAAVTLGPKVTKDALIQGCMRMRKLGHGHTVIFFAQPGVDQSIRAVTGKQDRDIQITISDVLSWTIQETWVDIQHRAPYWAQQGIDHQSRYDALSLFCNKEVTQKQLSDAWLQPNCKSLTELYAPPETEEVQSNLSTVPGIQQQCKVLGILSLPNGQLEEEQEREVHREREREREVELPPKAEPVTHLLHPDIVSFVKTGVISPQHSGSTFLPIFTTLERSTAAARDADVWSPSILATADFSRTIKPESTKGTIDQYLRPVQWVLSGKTDRGPVLVILSPFEADCLMPDIRASKHVHLHLYAPRTAERTKPSDDLRLYTIPSLPSDWAPPLELIDQLNVFAGQLYLRDYESYLRLCRFLDVPTNESPCKAGKVRRNLLSMPGTFEQMEITFSDSPLPMVMALLAIRNRGRPFNHTHMGKILRGQVLRRKDFERPKSIMPDHSLLPPPPSNVERDVQPVTGSSVLHRPSKRELEKDENPATEGSSLKRPRMDGATGVSLPSTSDAQSQHGSKRTSDGTDVDQEPLRKRPHVA